MRKVSLLQLMNNSVSRSLAQIYPWIKHNCFKTVRQFSRATLHKYCRGTLAEISSTEINKSIQIFGMERLDNQNPHILNQRTFAVNAEMASECNRRQSGPNTEKSV